MSLSTHMNGLLSVRMQKSENGHWLVAWREGGSSGSVRISLPDKYAFCVGIRDYVGQANRFLEKAAGPTSGDMYSGQSRDFSCFAYSEYLLSGTHWMGSTEKQQCGCRTYQDPHKAQGLFLYGP